MEFEWDENKRLRTIQVRSLDFLDATNIFDGRQIITAPSAKESEERFISIALLDDNMFYAVVWTWREDIRRIISFRKARNSEQKQYYEVFPRNNQQNAK